MIDGSLTFIFCRVRKGDYINKIRALYIIASDLMELLDINSHVMSLTASPCLWDDGFVVAFFTTKGPEEISLGLTDALANLSTWTIYQGISLFLEDKEERPLRDAAWALRDKPVSFFFLLAKNNEFAFARHADLLIKEMKASVAYPVFNFENGVILAVSSNEPPKVTMNRCFRSLGSFAHWIFCSPNGETFRDDGTKECWMDADLIIDAEEDDLSP